MCGLFKEQNDGQGIGVLQKDTPLWLTYQKWGNISLNEAAEIDRDQIM